MCAVHKIYSTVGGTVPRAASIVVEEWGMGEMTLSNNYLVVLPRHLPF